MSGAQLSTAHLVAGTFARSLEEQGPISHPPAQGEP